MDYIGKNLKRIRLLKNLSLEKAGSLMNMTATAIAKYEKGLIIPNSEKLIEFANAYNVKVFDLLKVHNVPEMKFNSFRKKQRLKGQNLELLKEIIQNKVSDYLEVIELNNIKSNNYKLRTYACNNINNAEEAANSFRINYKLSVNQPIPDLISILENIGILIIQIDNINENFSDFDGLSEIVNNVPVIVILKNNDGARQRFTIAHELGHLVLEIKNKQLDEEKMCHRFASSLLMPREAVIKEFGEKRDRISFYELIAFKKEYRVSMNAIVYRLKDIGIITDHLFKRINIIFNINHIKKDEPEKIKSEESTQFARIVHKLETDNIISLNKACELLEVTSNEYKKQDNNYGY